LTKPPSIFKKEGRTYLFSRFKSFLLATFTVRSIKKELVGWKPKDFAKESSDSYILMNQAYLGNNKETLRQYCTASMLSHLSPSMGVKDTRYEWKYHGDVSRPLMVHARYSFLT
jgi:hypothetical protein